MFNDPVQLFPLALTNVPVKVIKAFDCDSNELRAVTTSEFRPPKKDEWFIGESGFACLAVGDLTVNQRIARIVRVRTETITTILQLF